MEVASSAVGIASLGIQVCQGLLSFYDSWRGYKADFATAYNCIDDLCKTFKLLEETLVQQGLDPARSERVEECLGSCISGLEKLQKKLQKLQTYSTPSGLRQKTWSELQRLYYPFKESTLVKLREIVSDLRERLSLAIQILQLDLSASSHRSLAQISVDVEDTAANVRTLLTTQQADHFHKIVDWLSPPDPWTNHASARRHHEPQTGSWLLQSNQYQRWKSGQARHLWLYGKAGCGKTVLSSTVIEDVQLYCKTTANAGLAVFYFSFSDSRKQSFENLLCSLVAQLGWKEPGRSMLQQEYDKPNRSMPGLEALEGILISSISHFDDAFVALDALDECPESEDARRHMLDNLERLSKKASNLKIFATSRELRDIKECMDSLEAEVIATSTRPVDADIRRYVASELSRDRKLRALDEPTKHLIEGTFARKADGMFRWVFCQLLELKKLKSTKPKRLQEALQSLPTTLDATYEQMLIRIEQGDRTDALTALRWLVFQHRPLSLGEIAEATIIEPSGDGAVETDNRGSIEDVLELLAGLVTVEDEFGHDDESVETSSLQSGASGGGARLSRTYSEHVDKDTRIRLAHFSVKEYLVSNRILEGKAKGFHLQEGREHQFLTRSCLTYLLHYSDSDLKTSSKQDLAIFPLLGYTARAWFYHYRLQNPDEDRRYVDLLGSDRRTGDWLLVHDPDVSWMAPFEYPRFMLSSGLYVAILLGFEDIATELVARGADVNAQGGMYGNVLQAASARGHEKIVEMLIKEGADVNALGGLFNSALQAASNGGYETLAEELGKQGTGHSANALNMSPISRYERVVEVLIEHGADVNAQGGICGDALHSASLHGSAKITKLLINGGANVNAQGKNGQGEKCSTALYAASKRGREKIVELLIEGGADINAPGGPYGNTALHTASRNGFGKIVKMLVNGGADPNAGSERTGLPLFWSSARGYEEVVKTLIDAGADVNGWKPHFGSALYGAACYGQGKIAEMLIDRGANVNAHENGDYNALRGALREGHQEVVEILMVRGADFNIQGGYYGNTLQAASIGDQLKAAAMLIERGAEVNARGGYFGSALQAASWGGHEKVVEMLIERGAEVNAQGGRYGNALYAASHRGHEKVVEMLIERGAEVNAQGGYFGNALQAASWRSNEKVVEMLIEQGAEVNVQGGYFGNALQAASWGSKVMEMLIANGARKEHIA